MNQRRTDRLLDGTSYAILAVAMLLVLFPIFWLAEAGLKSPLVLNSYPPRFVGFSPQFGSYESVLNSSGFQLDLRNTVIATAGSAALAVMVGTLGAYGLVRLKPYGFNWLVAAVVLVQTIPAVAILIPLFSIVSTLGLYDQLITEIVVLAALEAPFATWVMVAFIRGIPIEVEEAARVDGASRWRVIQSLVFPMARPGIVTAAVFSAMASWNQFIVPIVLTTQRATPLSIYIASFFTQKGPDWGPLCAATFLVLLPVGLFALSQQKRLVGGLTMGTARAGAA